MKNILSKFSVTFIAVALGYKYLAEPSSIVIRIIDSLVIIYSILLVLTILLIFIVFIMHKFLVKYREVINSETIHALATGIDSVYKQIGKRNIFDIIYSPIFSLITIFSAFNLGLWFLVVTEALSEYLNLKLTDKARQYLQIMGELDEEAK
jgi:hypothetical protein